MFRGAVDPDTTTFVLKFPRPIERRNANPSMDLYDYVISLGPNGFDILCRNQEGERGWSRTHATVQDLIAVESGEALLAGTLRFHLASGKTVEIPYNSVSSEIIDSFTRAARAARNATGPDRQPTRQAAKHLRLDRTALGESDLSVVNRFNELLRSEPSLTSEFLRPRANAKRQGGAFSRLLDMVSPRHLNAAIFARSGNELVIVHRLNSGLEKRLTPEHSLAFTAVQRDSVSLEVTRSSRWEDVRELRLAPTSIVLYTHENDGTESYLRSIVAKGESDIPGQ